VTFIVMVDEQTQVGLMDAESGTWDVLTRRLESGVRIHPAWWREVAKIYFTRGTSRGVNIYSIPAVGGEERLDMVLADQHSQSKDRPGPPHTDVVRRRYPLWRLDRRWAGACGRPQYRRRNLALPASMTRQGRSPSGGGGSGHG
jgi:hypothetical protein